VGQMLEMTTTWRQERYVEKYVINVHSTLTYISVSGTVFSAERGYGAEGDRAWES
jgi:hypothetical protein